LLVLGLVCLTGTALSLALQNDAEATVGSRSGNYQELPLQLPATAAAAGDSSAPLPSPTPDTAHLPIPEEPRQEAVEPAVIATAEADQDWQLVQVKSGDSLAKIFNSLGLSAKNMYEVLDADAAAKTLTRIFPGEQISFLIEDGRLSALRYPVDESVTLHVDSTEQGYETSLVAVPLERRLAHVSATIDSSLFLAGKSAGLSDNLIMQLANVFAWDVDFALDIRSGDGFIVVYEEIYRNGEKIRDGDIVAAEFTNRGRNFRAVTFADSRGNREFFSPDGKSMRKAFLRSPVDFRRISSNFNPNRLHPKLGVKRPHRGVDYAAATGTPIRAAGDGKIVHLGTKGGYGRTIIIQHGSKYSTLYAHMSRYAKNIAQGSRVRQGQTIGYVGSSGLATGPHLHYEFLVNGVHRNPVTVPLPEAQPIAQQLMPEFLVQTAPLVAQLEVLSRSMLALQQQQPEE
jgi:murein DD-endopeptidase MepM/ murein hydrolase activator NlpD